MQIWKSQTREHLATETDSINQTFRYDKKFNNHQYCLRSTRAPFATNPRMSSAQMPLRPVRGVQ